MNNNIKIELGIIVVVSLIFITACSNKSNKARETDNTNDSNFSIAIGKTEKENIVLNSNAVKSKKIDNKYIIKIHNLIKGTHGYDKENKELLSVIKEINSKHEDICISLNPVFQWLSDENSINYNYPKIFVFSSDHKKAWIIQLMLENNKYSFLSYNKVSDYVLNELTTYRKNKYIYIGAYDSEIILSNTNNYIPLIGTNSNNITINGDYYGKLINSGINFSYEEITNNVVKI